jgi:hypothetical protein
VGASFAHACSILSKKNVFKTIGECRNLNELKISRMLNFSLKN